VKAPPDWLRTFQRRFGRALEEPLRLSGRHLEPTPNLVPTELREDTAPSHHGDGGATIAVYQRQGWLRRFSVAQAAFPLTARLVGLFAFNRLVSDFTRAHPPSHFDLARSLDGLAAALASYVEAHRAELGAHVAPEAILEAIALDEAYRRVTESPSQPRLAVTAIGPSELGSMRLVPRTSVAWIQESWALCDLRRRAREDGGENQLTPGAPLVEPRTVLLARLPDGIAEQTLPPIAAALVPALARSTVAEALSEVATTFASVPHDELARAITWTFARTTELGVWHGLTANP
jgi:hypothetical protein